MGSGELESDRNQTSNTMTTSYSRLSYGRMGSDIEWNMGHVHLVNPVKTMEINGDLHETPLHFIKGESYS